VRVSLQLDDPDPHPASIATSATKEARVVVRRGDMRGVYSGRVGVGVAWRVKL
jgi:hypothetical protein